jgi:hypothetical protein
VLIKEVLESQPVYWMSMAAVPNSVLVKLHQLIFSFLWSGCSERNRLHLCNWETIARPKKDGGWGLRNISFFNKYLAAKTFWRGLTKVGIWHKVIKDKYLPYCSVSTWFRSVNRSQGSTSPVWRNILKVLPLLDHWLYWKPGNGEAVQVGRDCIMGMGQQSFLSNELIVALKLKGVTFLYQAHNFTNTDPLSSYWQEVSKLGLYGDLATEWEDYRSALMGARIQLTDLDDELMWSGGDGSGIPSVSNIYKALSESLWHHTTKGWSYKLWKWNISLKIIFFFWLVLRNKVLTWENLLSKGWEGPSFWILCRTNLETQNHLFIHFPFTRQVWNLLAGTLKSRLFWDGNTVDDCMSTWVGQHPKLIELPVLVCWFIWLERNMLLFNNGNISPHGVAFKSIGSFNVCVSSHKIQNLYRVKRPPRLQQMVGWFDGALLLMDLLVEREALSD